MSKKSRKNSSKPAPTKVAKRASGAAAVKAATKSPAKKAAAKSTKAPTKAAVKPAAKAAPKPATKTAKVTVTKVPAKKASVSKAAVAKTVVAKTVVTKTKAARTKVAKTAVTKTPVTETPVAKTAAVKTVAAPTPATTAKPAAVRAAPAKPAAAIAAPAAPRLAVEGAQAPAFQLPRDGGATVSLSDYAGQKLVIFFYPRASTPGCTKEAIDFTRLSPDFAAAGTAILGVSADPLKAQENFRDKHDLSMPLLSDDTQAMLKAYGAWGEKSMYGKVFEGVLRTTVLISGGGTVARIWRSVKVDGHADAVLEEARGI